MRQGTQEVGNQGSGSSGIDCSSGASEGGTEECDTINRWQYHVRSRDIYIKGMETQSQSGDR